jgi:hypothetical protein
MHSASPDAKWAAVGEATDKKRARVQTPSSAARQ